MKKVEERYSKIMEILNQVGRMEVSVLSEKCHVSLVTMRKDLTELEKRGFLNREQGFAVLANGSHMRRRIAVNYAEKRRIAQAAATLIQDGETIMIESGSCCILLAEEISRTKQNITIITNSVFMAEYIGGNPNINLVLLGGDYQTDSQALVGPISKYSAKQFHVSKFFAGTDGYSHSSGFTGDNHLRVETLKNMAKSAEQIVIITESKKFEKQGIVPLFSTEDVSYLITDNRLPQEIEEELQKAGIQILKAAL